MTANAIRGWQWVHRSSSLVSTGFLLMLCLTGLPLIFHNEIDALTGDAATMAGLPSASHGLPLDVMLARALAAAPGDVPLFMAFDNHGATLTVTTAPRPDSPEADMTVQLWNRTSGEAAGAVADDGVMHVILQLHVDMFAGLPGMLFLGAMGVLFLVAILSGVVLYAPFMRRLPFGTLRTGRSARLKWLDTHNLLGVVTLAWVLVVGATGVIHTLATPIIDGWRTTELAEMTAAYAGRAALDPADYGSLDRAMAAARGAVPGANPQFIAFPGGSFSSKHHFAVFMQGDSALTERLLTPVLVDARTGVVTDVRDMPLMVQALQLSQPLHFGDYAGLPMKILWAALDLVTIVVLASGLWLWARRRWPVVVAVGAALAAAE